MTAAQTRSRLRQYLAYKGADRAHLRFFLNTITNHLEDASIFGGMVRDFSLGYARSFRSDIDVVTLSPAKDIYNCIKHLNPIRNKFGGFRFIAGEYLFDIWSFYDTWAIQEGLIAGETLKDLCDTTFFSLDAALFRLNDEKLITSSNYETHVKNRILGINLREHPDPIKIAKRAIQMALAKNLTLTSELCEFIVRNINADARKTYDAPMFHRIHEHLEKTPYQNFKPHTQLSIWPSEENCEAHGFATRHDQSDACRSFL
ncbi:MULTISPECIES: hypothetical protein [unclassified Paraburkholderia]|uniref:hypothetical protein n=1 Tax=unclassified Paraburkholderia TaxID=2615204 RepID=UPI002AAFD8F6|nr:MULTISPECIES: hypothetical protein [unclassified Paraburkholderia]